jgi:hypothetical protein
VRFAPAASKDTVYFGSDDGCVYAVDAAAGALRWRFRAAPAPRLVLGNRRLISVWPVRGGPVLDGGRLYFAAGVWPMEGVFVYCLDAETGSLIWRNDEAGSLYGKQPHEGEGIAGLCPQGYLSIAGDELIVPSSAAYPASFDLATGALRHFELPSQSRLPGGWFAIADPEASRERRRGRARFDAAVNSDRHEDRPWQGHGELGLRDCIEAGGRTLRFADALPGVEGEVCSLAAADGKLFAATRQGVIHAFAAGAGEPKVHPRAAAGSVPAPADGWGERAEALLSAAGARDGHALCLGIGGGRLIEELARRSRFHVIGIDPDASRIDALRRRFDALGLYGTRIALIVAEPRDLELPPYLARLVTSEDELSSGAAFESFAAAAFPALRPFGGAIAAFVEGRLEVRRRDGPLPGATDYRGGFAPSPDALVGAPLGLLWFDDALVHFKRSPQPEIIEGWMVSRPKDWLAGDRPPYVLQDAVFSDIYSGRVLAGAEADAIKRALGVGPITARQPDQYRPPTQKNAWKPEPPVAGERLNPLTGLREPRAFPKSYGCDGGIDYGFLYTLRSATPAYYDKRIESGTVNISGPRSGCTNSLIPAGGLLNVPYFFEGCTCSYPLPVGLALVKRPETHEQWASWGAGTPGPIRRLGLNLGAPGDRAVADGTLWLEFPARGGPSPALEIAAEPEVFSTFYRHSLWLRGGRGWPWVAASGAIGLRRLAIGGLAPGRFTMRLYFLEPEARQPGERVFDLAIQGGDALTALDVAAEAGGTMRALVRELDGVDVAASGVCEIRLTPRRGETVLSGVELIQEGLAAGEPPSVPARGE